METLINNVPDNLMYIRVTSNKNYFLIKIFLLLFLTIYFLCDVVWLSFKTVVQVIGRDGERGKVTTFQNFSGKLF